MLWVSRNLAPMSELEDVALELAAIQDRLLELPDDAFAERYELNSRQDRLRASVESFREKWAADRPTSELEAELAALQTYVDRQIEHRVGISAGPGCGEMARLALDARRAAGIDAVVARISALRDQLANRSEDA